MNHKEPEPKKTKSDVFVAATRRARYTSTIVCILCVMFLFGWFLFVKRQYDFNILLYCLSPILMFLVLNGIFDFAYHKGKD